MGQGTEKRKLGRIGAAAALAAGLTAGAALVAPTPAGAADPSADLSVALSHDPPTGTTQDVFTFTVAVTNDGPDAAADTAVGFTTGYRLQVQELPEGCTRDIEWTSIICDLGDLAAGSTTTVDLPLKSYGSGLYQLSAVAASVTPDPDRDDLVADDSLLVRKGPSQAERYVAGIFPIVLQRDPDPSSKQYWVNRWQAENARYPRNLAKIPLGLMNSDEYRRIRIRDAYVRILARNADAPSLAYWVGKARAGWSFDAIERTLLASREFAAKHPGQRLEASLAAMFGRPATADELDQWRQVVGSATDSSSWSRFLAAAQRSTAARDRVITDLVDRTFGRPPGAFERFAWLVRFQEGASAERIWADVLVSWEFLADYPYTDDDYNLPEYEYSAGAPALADQVRAAAAG